MPPRIWPSGPDVTLLGQTATFIQHHWCVDALGLCLWLDFQAGVKRQCLLKFGRGGRRVTLLGQSATFIHHHGCVDALGLCLRLDL